MYYVQSVIQALALPLQWMDNSPTPIDIYAIGHDGIYVINEGAIANRLHCVSNLRDLNYEEDFNNTFFLQKIKSTGQLFGS